MGFHDLAPQSPINPEADAYGARCLAISRDVADHWECSLDVPYGPDPHHRLDIYVRPKTPAAPTASAGASAVPVLVFLHGGGFTHGYKEWCGFMAPAIAPCLLVAVRYRLMPAVSYPEPWLDAIEALRWVRQHIGAYGGDPDRIVVGGHSAGGAIAACVSAQPDWLAQRGLAADTLAGTVCLSTTFHRFAVSGSAGSAYTLQAGPLPIDGGSPLSLLGSARGPYFIAWGGRERQRERVERGSMSMITGLRDRGLAVTWRFEEEADHFGTHLALADPLHALSSALRGWLATVAAAPSVRP